MADHRTVAIAEGIARAAHTGQTDKLGAEYIDHPARVAQRVERYDDSAGAVAAAWLHDVLEDTDRTAEDLRAAGIPEQVIEAVGLLSKVSGQSLEEYCRGVRGNALALAVKRADIDDNTDPSRTAGLPPEIRERLAEKYRRTRELLGVS